MAVPWARGVVWVPFALKYKIPECACVNSPEQLQSEPRLWVRAPARSHVSSQSGPPAESPVKASVRPAVEGPHRLAQFCVHAAALLKKLPDRAAKGHEALGEVDPQHGRVRSSAWLAVKGTCLVHGVQQGVRGRAHVGKPGVARAVPSAGVERIWSRGVRGGRGWSKVEGLRGRVRALPSV
eukprot:scaffold12272_cov65-Phaeocystis_antarctica.AAC.2